MSTDSVPAIDAGLQANVVPVNSLKPVDEVLATAPKAGTELVEGSTVRVNVSKGPKPVTVPSVIGTPYESAESQLQGLGEDDPSHTLLSTALRDVVNGWADEVKSLGLEAKGMWLVDFDNGEGRLGVMDLASGEERLLTNREMGGWGPTWSADSDRIAFTGSGGDWELFVIGADGSDLTRLTNTLGEESNPAWWGSSQ